MNKTVVYEYTLQQAIADGELVELFKDRWEELTGGKPIVATRHIYTEFNESAFQYIWDMYVHWAKHVEPSLPEEERMFSTKMHDKTVWVIEDGQAFTILFPEDY